MFKYVNAKMLKSLFICINAEVTDNKASSSGRSGGNGQESDGPVPLTGY